MEVRALAYIGLGANVGAARETLALAIVALAALPSARLRGVSRLYRTRPVGPVAQADFLNAVVALDVPRGADPETGAMALMIALKQLEQAFGRRERERWGPRELDLDLLLFGEHRIRIERASAAGSADHSGVDPQWLQVPHPSAAERLFVLAPLSDLAPGLIPPGWGASVADRMRLARANEGDDAARPVAIWDADAASWLDMGTEPGAV